MTQEERDGLFLQMRQLPEPAKNKILSILFSEMEGCEKANLAYRTDDFFKLIQEQVDQR